MPLPSQKNMVYVPVVSHYTMLSDCPKQRDQCLVNCSTKDTSCLFSVSDSVSSHVETTFLESFVGKHSDKPFIVENTDISISDTIFLAVFHLLLSLIHI